MTWHAEEFEGTWKSEVGVSLFLNCVSLWMSENPISFDSKLNGLQWAAGMGGFEPLQLRSESRQERHLGEREVVFLISLLHRLQTWQWEPALGETANLCICCHQWQIQVGETDAGIDSDAVEVLNLKKKIIDSIGLQGAFWVSETIQWSFGESNV